MCTATTAGSTTPSNAATTEGPTTTSPSDPTTGSDVSTTGEYPGIFISIQKL